VIINIVTNAVQSLFEKRQICSRDGNQFSGKLQISTARQSFSIRIAIADNGMGINPEIRTKIFDPFFSTKPTGQGTGLGLSICHRIVEEHKGKLFFESVDDLTIFVVELPIENKQIYS
jgi:signal transduction histidine kinase